MSLSQGGIRLLGVGPCPLGPLLGRPLLQPSQGRFLTRDILGEGSGPESRPLAAASAFARGRLLAFLAELPSVSARLSIRFFR